MENVKEIDFEALFAKLVKVSALYDKVDNLSPEDVGRFQYEARIYFKAEIKEIVQQLSEADWK